MNIEEIREYCLSYPFVTEELPFDEVTLVFKVKGKMFALTTLDSPELMVSVKCDPELAIQLREQHPFVRPAFHFNKKYWNSVDLNSDVSDDFIKACIFHSYEQVIKKMSKSASSDIIVLLNKIPSFQEKLK